MLLDEWGYKLDSLLGCSGRSSSKTSKAIVLTQDDLHPKFSCQIGPPVHSAIYWLCLPFFQLEHHWASQLSSVFVGPSVHIGLEDIFHSGWGNVPIPLPGQEG